MKYELIDKVVKHGSSTLHRIRALKDFGSVKKGDIGGFIKSEANLSQEGDAWVYDNALVFDNARVGGSARVCDDVHVCGDARVCGNAKVCGSAIVCGTAVISCCALVYGNAWINDNASVYGDAMVFDNAHVCGNVHVCNNAHVSGDVEIMGEALICGDANVKSLSDYSVFKNTWSSGRWFTYTASNKMWCVGCFYGTGEELIAKAYKDSELSGKCYETIVRAVEAMDEAKARAKIKDVENEIK